MAESWIDIHTHRKWSDPDLLFVRQAWTIRRSDFPYYLSKGIHPWLLEKFQNQSPAFWDELLSSSNVLFIGESGLDRLRPDVHLQLGVFKEMKLLAERFGKPLMIHNVRMHQEIQRELKGFQQPFVLHGFSGNEVQLNDWLRFDNAYFSIGLRELKRGLPNLPIDRLFLETDQSRFHVKEAYNMLCSLSGMELPNLQSQITRNFIRVFPQFQAKFSGAFVK